jgi:SAM-dependent methyltransferase
MRAATITALNQLNQQFYTRMAHEFSVTREYPWPGWAPIGEYLASLQKSIKVLDVGCGNGRFGEYLETCGLKFSYWGLDSTPRLLELAKKRLRSIGKVTLLTGDLYDELIHFTNRLKGERFDLIGVFGVMHHVAGGETRENTLKQLQQLLDDHGILAVSYWQFGEGKRFEKKMIDPGRVLSAKISQDLEPGDAILNWNDNPKLARYCHLATEHEAEELARRSGLKIVKRYRADGKSGRLNLYHWYQADQ